MNEYTHPCPKCRRTVEDQKIDSSIYSLRKQSIKCLKSNMRQSLKTKSTSLMQAIWACVWIMTHIKIFLLHYINMRLSKETVIIKSFSSKHTHTDTQHMHTHTYTHTALALIHWPRGWLLCKTSVLPHFHRKSASFLWCQLCLWAVERKTQSTTLVLSDYQ